MKNNFDAALSAYDSWMNAIIGQDISEGLELEKYKEEIRFALRFTKAALSGEVSENVVQSGLDGDDCIQSFTAMCQQLAKEVGNGNE